MTEQIEFNHEIKSCIEQNETTYLTLGDGDLTYSFDLCRFLQAEAALEMIHDNQLEKPSMMHQRKKTIRVVCTGIDPLSELEKKYKDSQFIKNKLMFMNGIIPSILSPEVLIKEHKTNSETIMKDSTTALDHNRNNEKKVVKRPRINNNKQNTLLKMTHQTRARIQHDENSNMNVSIHHCVNAIIPFYENDQLEIRSSQQLKPSPPLPILCKYQRVIFNHPHIGNEDAKLHSRFLSHFFHSVHMQWLAENGIAHMTLVKGQCERWKCIEAAEKHGFVLVHRDTFSPPPSPGDYILTKLENIEKINERQISNVYRSKQAFQCRYQHRRHQSGRSFASRAKDGSETLSFARKVELDYIRSGVLTTFLPWHNLVCIKKQEEDGVECPHCKKHFVDERACKNHIRCIHADEKKKKLSSIILCEICDDGRIFSNMEALLAHKKAKHGRFTDIKPLWAAGSKAAKGGKDSEATANDKHHSSDPTVVEVKENENSSNEIIGKCNVCGLEFRSHAMKLKHYSEFIPDFSTATTITGEETQNKVMRDLLSFTCVKCNKGFRDLRAQQQHENFCSVEN